MSSPQVGVYPPNPVTYGWFHLMTEYTYEFLKGSRLATVEQLNPCENNISDFIYDIQQATLYYQTGLNNQNGD